jgi:hypothetical protein
LDDLMKEIFDEFQAPSRSTRVPSNNYPSIDVLKQCR